MPTIQKKLELENKKLQDENKEMKSKLESSYMWINYWEDLVTERGNEHKQQFNNLITLIKKAETDEQLNALKNLKLID